MGYELTKEPIQIVCTFTHTNMIEAPIDLYLYPLYNLSPYISVFLIFQLLIKRLNTRLMLEDD